RVSGTSPTSVATACKRNNEYCDTMSHPSRYSGNICVHAAIPLILIPFNVIQHGLADVDPDQILLRRQKILIARNDNLNYK
ncbi:hypothetical protein, partial [Marinobacter sp.]|uniref:hypothetical protein n=1 Tax=Marinobacter sp. TaxID=50741 RepID=UPI00356528E4